MIAFIRGQVLEIRLTSLVIDLNGMGYELIVAPEIANSATRGSQIELFTSLVVREDSWTLYGFRTVDAKTLFEELRGVTGIGPKVAASLLAFFQPDELRGRIAESDSAALESVPGIGKKVASRIILELKDRYSQGRSTKSVGAGKWRENLIRALTGLGYSAREAERAIERTVGELPQDPAEIEISELLRRTLATAREDR
jgi:Holliday junction DNA helicase RuvA